MTVEFDGMTVFTSQPVDENFQGRIRTLFKSKIPPRFIWVDNKDEYYYYWKHYALYVRDGATVSNCDVSLGGYSLVIQKDSTVSTDGDNKLFILNGKFIFYKNLYSYTGNNLSFDYDGIFKFQITDISVDDFYELEVGVKYFTHDYDDFLMQNIAAEVFAPLISANTGSDAVTAIMAFMPVLPEKCAFKLEDGNIYQSSFLSVYGIPVKFALGNDFCFVFQPDGAVNPEIKYYLAPSGSVMIKEDIEFMLGLSCTEYVRLKSDDSFVFVPGQRAYFDDYKLITEPKTSYIEWARVKYYSQPQNSAFYDSQGGKYRYFSELPSVDLQNILTPTLPFSLIKRNTDKAKLIEENFLSVNRRQNIEDSAAKSYMSRLNSASRIVEARQGVNIEIKNDKISTINVGGIVFSNPGFNFICGIQASDVLIVMNNAEYLKNHVTIADDLNITVDGWNFVLSPKYWEYYNSVMIIKITEKASLAELMKQPHMWSFSPAEEEIRKVQEYFRTVKERSDRVDNDILEAIINDKNWQGVVIFDAGVDVKKLPPEITFLADGIVPEKFKALFFCYTFGAVQPECSALIDYRDEEHQYFEDFREYSFKVLNVNVDIRNGIVNNFSARIELLVNKLFGGRTMAVYGESGNNLIFDGSYQKSDTQGGHYSFVMNSAQLYTISGSAVNAINIDSAEVQSGSASARFVLNGITVLYNTGTPDIFSFDKLPYAGLTIEMKNKNFKFLAEYMRFISENVSARENSFVSKFPAFPSKIVYYADKTPEALGYARMKVQNLKQDKIEAEWHGLQWDINIGNLGGLASNAIASISLLTAWAANPAEEKTDNEGYTTVAQPKIFIGIRLGGSGNADNWELPLQGVMTLGFDAIELRTEKDYCFVFKNFALRILGIRFPNASNDMYLLADESRNLAWYGKMEGK